jgi:hypothetical protein
MLSEEGIELRSVEDHFVSRKKDRPGDNLEEDGDVFVTPAVVADNNIGALFDEILLAPDFDFFAEEGKIADPHDHRPESFVFLFKGRHGDRQTDFIVLDSERKIKMSTL